MAKRPVETLNVLAISDIHAIEGDPFGVDAVSYYSADPSFAAFDTRNPFRTIPKILKEAGLAVDWVLCPGDLADRAQPVAQSAAWRSLETLRQKLKARLLVGTVGNHDVDSRLNFSEFDVKGSLQSLSPFFPGLGEGLCDFYWSRNFAIHEDDGVLLLVLNSSAFHGINSDHGAAGGVSLKEYEHGRVSSRTIAAIRQHLAGKQYKLKILLTHHHVYENDSIFPKDYSKMENATALLDALQDVSGGNWFVLHGHQHYPCVTYGHGDSASPVIFSAGSFSRRLNDLSAASANQFYHLQFPIGKYGGLAGC